MRRLTVLGAIAWMSSFSALPSALPNQDTKATFELRLAETKNAIGLTEVTVAGSDSKIYLHKEVVLTNKDIMKATVIVQNEQPVIEVVFVESARKTLAQLTAKNRGKLLAMIVGGKVLFAPTIRAEIPEGRAHITGSWTREDAERIVATLTRK